MKVLSVGTRTAPSGNERPGQAVLPVPSRCGMAGTRDRHCTLYRADLSSSFLSRQCEDPGSCCVTWSRPLAFSSQT